MIIAKLKGGLGNQMFQYAFGKYLAIKNNTKLGLDLNFLLDRTPRKFFIFRDYELDIFNHNAPVYKDDNFSNYTYFKEKHFHFDPQALKVQDNTLIDGYWQSEKYFKEITDVLRKDFTFKKQLPEELSEISEDMQKSNSVCLHVRYGYLNNQRDKYVHGFVGLKYIHKAIDFISKQIKEPEIYIFSDNPEWCKSNIKSDFKIYLPELDFPKHSNSDYFQLMTHCKHFIISNSSFSWWAAWLAKNPDKIVIAPKRWFRFSLNNTKDLIPNNWIRI